MERILRSGDGSVQLVQAQLTDIGCRRDKNEDALGFFAREEIPATQLAVICDGVGGNAAGEVASQLAVKTVERSFFAMGSPVDPASALHRALLAANAAIQERAAGEPSLLGMATTCTAAAFRGGHLHLAHVGDCRAYFIAGGEINQLTRDHSLAEEYTARGEPLLPNQQGLANVLTRCLGLDPAVEVDLSGPLVFPVGATLLLCSDGLTKVVSPEEICEHASNRSPGDACLTLVTLARERGGPDNISVQVIRARAGKPL